MIGQEGGGMNIHMGGWMDRCVGVWMDGWMKSKYIYTKFDSDEDHFTPLHSAPLA